MAPLINRKAIFLTLAAFFGFGAFCVSTEAPLIQQDILKRCQDKLLTHQISIEGLAVDGRDVVLSGSASSALLSAGTRLMLAEVSGVREVRVKILAASQSVSGSRDGQPAASTLQSDVQEKIDRVLENQGIAFKAESAVLTTGSETVLDQVAAYLSEVPALRCEIRGYDNHPHEVERPNLVLALQRALAAEDYLLGKGIAEWRLSTHSFKTGEGTENRPRNRAVDFVVRVR